ncbi:hypothetical protein DF185_01585 [Marinifilum breve]|uniref:DUF4412 domain-containing protein n=1 Tax=Marinifilum breve TaxID=2184082 RepID=A0A2V4A206_9BACT|nr:hypothetical protein [Marinifilum breve]PXY02809.1 hypothetical protein DF185_01585 [Marinifilum breve]
MKKIQLILLAVIICIGNYASAQHSSKRFMVKSGYVEMKLDGTTKGQRLIWFDDYGKLYKEEVKSETKVKVFGIESSEKAHTLTIVKDGVIYNVNQMDQTGTKLETGISSEYYAAFENMSDAQKEEFADEMLEAFGGQRLGTEKFFNRTCEKVKALGTTVWSYKGVVLKSEAKMLGIESSEVAVKFDENIKIASSTFDVPGNISWGEPEMRMGQALDMFSGEEMDYDSDDEEVFPVEYPYNEFQVAVGKVKYSNFIKSAVFNVDGQYVASFTKTMTENFTIVASSDKGIDSNEAQEEMAAYSHFTHAGKKDAFW